MLRLFSVDIRLYDRSLGKSCVFFSDDFRFVI